MEKKNIILTGDFDVLNTKNTKVFAYSRKLNNDYIIVIGNLDFKTSQNKITIKRNEQVMQE